MQDVIDPLPLGSSPKYDLSDKDMVFYLNYNRELEFYNGGEPLRHIDVPLSSTISVKELIEIREGIKKNVVSGKILATIISDGGSERGCGLAFIATKGTVINYK